jgi:hypothetical protein
MNKTPLVDYLGQPVKCFVCEGPLFEDEYTYFSNPYGSLSVEVHVECWDALDAEHKADD